MSKDRKNRILIQLSFMVTWLSLIWTVFLLEIVVQVNFGGVYPCFPSYQLSQGHLLSVLLCMAMGSKSSNFREQYYVHAPDLLWASGSVS